MTKPVIQFVELVRQAYARQEQRYVMFCQVCGVTRAFVYVDNQGIFERYRCPECNVIREVAVR